MQNIGTGNVTRSPITGLPSVYDFFTDNYTIYSDGTTDFDGDIYKLDTSDLANTAHFVDPNTGDDTNDGLTWGTAFRTLTHAYLNGTRGIIVLRSGERYYEPSMWGTTDPVSRQITIITDGAEPATVVGGPGDISGEFTSTSGQTDVYQAVRAAPITVWDETATSVGLSGKWGMLTEQLDLAAVNASGGWYHDGTTLYVKLFDGRAPDANLRLQEHDLIGLGRGLTTNYYPCHVENVNFYCVRFRPFFYGSEFCMKNCEIAYAGMNALVSAETHSNGNGSIVYLYGCHVHSAFEDLISTTGANRSVYINTVSEYAYSLEGSVNAATNHVNGVVIGLNSVFANTKHNVVGDTSGAGGSLYIQCRAYKNIAKFETENYAAFKFDNDQASDPSLGIFIACSDKDDDGVYSLGGSLYAYGNCSLQGSDFRGITASDGVTVDTTTQYYDPRPVASASAPSSANAGVQVQLDASTSGDPIGKSLTYTWTQTAGPSVTLDDASAMQPSFNMPSSDVTFDLTVNNGDYDSLTTSVTVLYETIAPTANAGPDQSVAAGATITFDFSDSVAGDSPIASYSLTQTAGDSVTINSANPIAPTAVAPLSDAQQTLSFTLTVTDENGLTHTDTIDITVAAQAGSILNIIDKLDFTLSNDGRVYAYKGRANRESFRIKPASTAGLHVDSDGFFDFTVNNVKRVEVTVKTRNGYKSIDSNTDSIIIDGAWLHCRLGDIDIKDTVNEYRLTFVVYVDEDELGVVMISPDNGNNIAVKYLDLLPSNA